MTPVCLFANNRMNKQQGIEAFKVSRPLLDEFIKFKLKLETDLKIDTLETFIHTTGDRPLLFQL